MLAVLKIMRKELIIMIVIVSTINCLGQVRDKYYKSGIEKYNQENYAGAILDFTKINNCHYCGDDILWVKHTGTGQHRYNLDRKDSNKGYSKDNCVVCCKKCNYMKGSEFSYEEFKEIVYRDYKQMLNTSTTDDFLLTGITASDKTLPTVYFTAGEERDIQVSYSYGSGK